MKKCIVGFVLMALTACQQQKIGFVDNVKLMDEYQEKIDIEKKFEVKSQAHNQKRDSISQAFQIEAQAFQEKAQSMPQQKAQEEYGILQQRGQRIGQQLQQEEQLLQQQGQTEMDSLISKVKEQIRKYGKDNGYDYILGGGNGGSVLFGKENKDLTQEILKQLNANYSK